MTTENAMYARCSQRSASEPLTIVVDVDENAQPKNQRARSSGARCTRNHSPWPTYRSTACARPSSASQPYASDQPIAYHAIAETNVSSRFLIRIAFVFFERTEPASSSAKPSCMMKTSMPPIMHQNARRPRCETGQAVRARRAENEAGEGESERKPSHRARQSPPPCG